MPTTYTHYRFGQEVFAALPEKQQEIIFSHIDLFNIGLHGPDILFYYYPFYWKNKVVTRGNQMHKESGLQAAQMMAEVLKKHGSEAHLAYVYGFLCHFALDRSCHGYVNAYKKEAGISHGEIEKEFDRRLLVHDGSNPLRTVRTAHIHMNRQNARVIADFYENVSPCQIVSAVSQFCLYDRLIAMPGKTLRKVVVPVLNRIANGRYNILMNEKPNPLCTKSNKELLRLYRRGIKDAVCLITEFPDSMRAKKPWNPMYDYNFSSVLKKA